MDYIFEYTSKIVNGKQLVYSLTNDIFLGFSIGLYTIEPNRILPSGCESIVSAWLGIEMPSFQWQWNYMTNVDVNTVFLMPFYMYTEYWRPQVSDETKKFLCSDKMKKIIFQDFINIFGV